MKKLTLKGCHLKEKLDFIKEIGMERTHEDYRYLMGWSTQEEELKQSKLRAKLLPKRDYYYLALKVPT